MRPAKLFAILMCPLLSLMASAQAPDFGPNVHLFGPTTAVAEMQATVDHVYAVQHHNEFGPERDAFLFMPGDYHLDLPIGFYTEVAGLGTTPNATHLFGNIHVDAESQHDNATTTFWRAAENFAVTPTGGTMQWAVSQAAPMRRLHILGDLVLNQNHGWASGGWMADTLVDGTVDSGTQQQWISRNSDWKSWTGANWNMVFVGVPHAPSGEWPTPPFTKVAETPVSREKPYLVVSSTGQWSIDVPALRHDSAGVTWNSGKADDRLIPFSDIYIARPDRDSASSMNEQLARGKSLLLTPGIYDLAEPIRVTRPNTVVFGMGFATLHPSQGTPALTTADADGIIVTGLLVDAGERESPVLMQIGSPGSKGHHQRDPISVDDVFFRVGGADVGRAGTNLEINSNDTLVDHTWIWRADHGHGVGWKKNLSRNGLVVHGDDVTIYGLFVEHHQQFQVLWSGERGRTYFYQSEIPYDPPTQADYTSQPGTDGWASYKVADTVKQHEAWGLGAYSVFTYPNVFLTHAIEVPRRPGVRFHDMITVCLLDKGGIRHIIDDAGTATVCAPPRRIDPKLTLFPVP